LYNSGSGVELYRPIAESTPSTYVIAHRPSFTALTTVPLGKSSCHAARCRLE